MENPNKTSNGPQAPHNVESLDFNSGETQVQGVESFPDNKPSSTDQRPPETYRVINQPLRSNNKTQKLARRLTIGAVVMLALILIAAYAINGMINTKKNTSSSQVSLAPTSYTVMSIPLNNLVQSGQLQVEQQSDFKRPTTAKQRYRINSYGAAN